MRIPGGLAATKFPSAWCIARTILGNLTVALSLFLSISQAQTLTYGVVVGTSLTSDFGNRTFFDINPVTGNLDHFSETPASKGFVMGELIIECHFLKRVSVEANGIYRALHYNETQDGPRDTVLTWEVPVLLKYSFGRAALLHPFVELGPTFRATGNLNETSPSHTGVSAGAGINIHSRFLDLAPGVRYTRWQADSGPALYSSKSDQVELLINFTRTSNFHLKRP